VMVCSASTGNRWRKSCAIRGGAPGRPRRPPPGAGRRGRRARRGRETGFPSVEPRLHGPEARGPAAAPSPGGRPAAPSAWLGQLTPRGSAVGFVLPRLFADPPRRPGGAVPAG
jgi:hypothetical protein